MCLISVAGKGTDKYDEGFLTGIRNGAKNNTDGYGYMIKYPGDTCVYYNKSFENIEDLLKEVAECKLDLDSELIVHSRTGNKGNKDKVNAHPFILTDSIPELETLFGLTTKPMMCHNGTFHMYSENNSIYSDTYHFIRRFMCIPEFISLMCRDTELFKSIFDSKLGYYNKLAFLFPNRDMLLLGDYKKSNGYYYSNDSYKDTSIRDAGGVNKSANLSLPGGPKSKSGVVEELFSNFYPKNLEKTKDNPFGIQINNFTKNEIYFKCVEPDMTFDKDTYYALHPDHQVVLGESSFYLYKVDEKLINNTTISSDHFYYKYGELVQRKDLSYFWVIEARQPYRSKYESYALLKDLTKGLSNNVCKKLLKAYNDSNNKETVSIKIEKRVYFILKSALRLLLFESFTHLKNGSHHTSLIEKDLIEFNVNVKKNEYTVSEFYDDYSIVD